MANNTNVELLSILVQMGHRRGGGKNPEAVAALLCSAPGEGKTSVVKGIGKVLAKKLKINEEDYPVECISAPQQAPENFGGVPVPTADKTGINMVAFAWAEKFARRASQNDGSEAFGIVLVDEILSAPNAIGAAAQTFILSGQLGSTHVGPGVARVAATNPPDTATAGRDMSTAETNRFVFIPNWEIDHESYTDFLQGGEGMLSSVIVLPENWERDYWQAASEMVLVFTGKYRPQLYRVEPKENTFTAWPSPRSWHVWARVFAAIMSLDPKNYREKYADLLVAACNGTVGIGAGTEFLQWIIEMDIVDAEDVLKDPENIDISKMKRSDHKLLLINNVVNAALKPGFKPEQHAKRWSQAAAFLERMAVKEEARDLCYTAGMKLVAAKPVGEAIPNIAGILHRIRTSIGANNKS